MGYKLPVIEKRKGGKGRRGILRILSGPDMYGLKRNVPGLCHLLQYRYMEIAQQMCSFSIFSNADFF